MSRRSENKIEKKESDRKGDYQQQTVKLRKNTTHNRGN